MYKEYWGFSRKPFENNLDHEFLYFSEKHEEALVRMLYTVSEKKSLMLLLGQGGSGKSLIARIFFNELSRRRYRGAYLTVVEDSPDALLRQWKGELGINAQGGDLLDMIGLIREHAIATSADGRESVLVIDNAENIKNPETFSFIKTVLNMERHGRRLFTVFLVGQNVLLGRVEKHHGLLSCVEMTYVLRPLSKEETVNYMTHRIKLVGGRSGIFTEDAFEEVYETSVGIPRKINSISDLALFAGAGKGIDRIDKRIVIEVKEELLQMKEVS